MLSRHQLGPLEARGCRLSVLAVVVLVCLLSPSMLARQRDGQIYMNTTPTALYASPHGSQIDNQARATKLQSPSVENQAVYTKKDGLPVGKMPLLDYVDKQNDVDCGVGSPSWPLCHLQDEVIEVVQQGGCLGELVDGWWLLGNNKAQAALERAKRAMVGCSTHSERHKLAHHLASICFEALGERERLVPGTNAAKAALNSQEQHVKWTWFSHPHPWFKGWTSTNYEKMWSTFVTKVVAAWRLRGLLPSHKVEPLGPARHPNPPPTDSAPESEFDKLPSHPGFDFAFGHKTDLSEGREFLKANDYVILRNFMHPHEVEMLKKYYQELVWPADKSNGRLVGNTNWGRAEAFMDRIGFELNSMYVQPISRIAGRPVKPAYSFLAYYRHNSSEEEGRPWLQPHTDNADNEFTISLAFHNQIPSQSNVWPLYVHAPRKNASKPVYELYREYYGAFQLDYNPTSTGGNPLKPAKAHFPPVQECFKAPVHEGDALLFRGRQHFHFREVMRTQPGDGIAYSGNILLHFVPDTFSYRMYDFPCCRGLTKSERKSSFNQKCCKRFLKRNNIEYPKEEIE